MAYNEIMHRGSDDFSVGWYSIDKNHPRYKMNHHWHREIEIIRVISGILNISVNNEDYTLKNGEIYVVNSEMVHGGVPDDCIYECIVFNPEKIFSLTAQTRSFLEELFSKATLIDNILKDKEAVDAANTLFESLKNKYKYCHFEAISALYGFFGVIVKKRLYKNDVELNYVIRDKKITKLKKVLSFIRESYAQQLSLEDMSKMAEMSPKYFCSVFKELTGQTPFDYLNSYRIERASSKLTGTDISVTEIAYSCGFNDLSYFIKSFKEKTGTTPAKYRKNV